MRILAVCQHYRPEPFNVSETCEELAARGHEVTVLTGLPNYPEGEVRSEYRCGGHRDEVIDGVRVVRVPIVARGKDLSGANKLRRVANYLSFPFSSWITCACMGGRYDVVLCFQFSPILMALPALRIAHKQGIPCLIWCFDLWPEDMLTGGFEKGGVPYRLMERLSKRVYGAADMVAVTSPRFSDYFSHELGLEGVGEVWLPQYAEEMFEELGVATQAPGDEKDVVLTFAGNVGGNQSVETIVRAAAMLPADCRVRVRIAGSGSRLEACESLADELAASNVEFLGRLPLKEMPGLYSGSDALLLTLAPSDGGSLVPVYTIPRKLQSYLAAGKPVLVCADGAAAEIVEGAGCGIACKAGDAEGLAFAMASFAAMPLESRNAMAERSRGLYSKRFSRKRFFNDIEDLLSGLAAGRRKE